MKLTDFDYNLPLELIAQYPNPTRDASRLLILDKNNGAITHRYFKDIITYLNPGDLLVLNNTKVLPARLYGRRSSGGAVEVLLLSQKNKSVFNALIRPARLKLNEEILFDHASISGRIISKNEIEFDTDNTENIYALGQMPLPPYIKRKTEKLDEDRYQTVYAKIPGAVASPTAGLHFTDALLSEIKAKGIDIVFVTLHVGWATFKLVKTDNITEHILEPEHFEVTRDAYALIMDAKRNQRRIIAVGTTSCRVLESLGPEEKTGAISRQTNIFIYPGYEFKIVDGLITNFHLPHTTLLMLVSAFAGKDVIMNAYREAIQDKYRFYSYGDAMFII